MPPDPHGPPADLDTTGKALYRKLRRFLEDAQRWENSDKYVLGNCCRDEQIMRVAWSTIPHERSGQPILTTAGRSENSGEVVHPNVRTAESASRRFLEGLRELGLTPRARAQLGFVSGGVEDDPLA